MNEKRTVSLEISFDYLLSYARSVGRLQHTSGVPYDAVFLPQLLKTTGPLDAEASALLVQAYKQGYEEGL